MSEGKELKCTYYMQERKKPCGVPADYFRVDTKSDRTFFRCKYHLMMEGIWNEKNYKPLCTLSERTVN